MNLTGIWTWIKSNMLLALGIAVGVLLLFFPKVLSGLFGSTRRRVRHRRNVQRAIGVTRRRRRVTSSPTRRRRTTTRKGAKKPWQIKGSLAARRHMAQIRRRR